MSSARCARAGRRMMISWSLPCRWRNNLRYGSIDLATSYTHAVVGLAIAPLYRPKQRAWLYWTLCAVLPVIPDLDVFSGYAYGSLWGHRGFTHSLPFALWFAFLVASLTYRFLG